MTRKCEASILDEAFEDLTSKILADEEALVVVLRGHLVTELMEAQWTERNESDAADRLAQIHAEFRGVAAGAR